MNTDLFRACFRVAGALLLVSTMFGPTIIWAETSYLVEYKAYTKAFESGDVEAALRHGEAAWRQAERSLGDQPTTAVLAYNYARMGSTHPQLATAASQAYERALALTNAGIGALDPSEIAIGRAELTILRDPEDVKATAALEQLLNERLLAGLSATIVSAQAWRSLASTQLRQKEPLAAYRSATQAVADTEALSPPDPPLLRAALLVRAMANISRASRRRLQESLIEATADLDRAIKLFPGQSTLDDFDRGLAQTIMWRQVAQSKYRSQIRSRKGRRQPEAEAITPLDLSGVWSDDAIENSGNCPGFGDHVVTTPPRYPNAEVNKRLVGAVLYGLTLTSEGIGRVVILAEPEGTNFGEVSVRTIKSWNVRDGYPARCYDKAALGTIVFGIR